MSNPHLFDNVNALVDTARREGDMVVWVVHSEENTGGLFDPVNGFVRVVDELKPLDDEPTLVKTAHNSFTTTNLGQRLAQYGVREIRITGIRIEPCCETTARVGSDLGGSYELLYVADAKAVASHQGVPLAASTVWPRVAPGDLIIVPGWRTRRGAVPRSEFAKRGLQAMLDHHQNGGTVASVCSGALRSG